MVSHIDQQAEVTQKVCTEDGVFDVSYHEHPPKSAAQTQVKRERSGAISGNGGVVHSLKGEVVCRLLSFRS
jgi:hypothetical protein